jgi:hypothetical protein
MILDLIFGFGIGMVIGLMFWIIQKNEWIQ